MPVFLLSAKTENPSVLRWQFGTCYDKGQSVALGLVAAGLVKVKDKGSGGEFEDMQTLQDEASSNGRGVHSQDATVLSRSIRDVVDGEFDMESFCARHKGKALCGVVERVRDGGCMGLYVFPEFQYINLFLSGVSAPRQLRDQETGQTEVQPYFYESKYVAESLVLGRNVMFYIDQCDKNGNPFGTILMEEGNIGEELLRRGLAKTVDWSLDQSVCKTGMRLAERGAREQMLGIWKDYVPPANANRKATGETSFQAKVIEVRSGDTLIIQRAGSQDLITVSLSSVRTPRTGNRSRQEPDSPWAYEAKEMLRSQCVGAAVAVKIDYMRLVGETERAFVTLSVKGKNAAMMLVNAGLAEVQRHRGDEDRSAVYDELSEAEEEAKKAKKRLHGPESAAPKHNFNDQSQTAQKARNFLPHLQRAGKVRAVVEFVANAGRLRLLLPDNASSISFGLAGVRSPSTARGDTPSQAFGDEAHFFSKLHTLQREVEVEVEAVDKGGTFMGTLWVNGESLGLQLLRNGYAWLQNADRSPYHSQMEAAEQVAQTAKLRVWENYDPEKEAREAAARQEEERKATPTVITVEPQFCLNGNSFFCHVLGKEADPLRAMRARQFERSDFSAPSAGGRYRANQYCSAEWQGDMYRARVIRHIPADNKYEVQFVDYGNTDVVASDKMQPWSGDTTTPPLAYECKLAYIKSPTLEDSDNYGFEAGSFLASLIMKKQLTAQIVAKAGDTFHLMLFDGDTNINAEAVRSGYNSLTKDGKLTANPTKELKELRAGVEHAKRSRLNMWQYGDGEDDDEDEPKGAWGR